MLHFLILDGRMSNAADLAPVDLEILPVLCHLGIYFGVPSPCEHALQRCRFLRPLVLEKADEDHMSLAVAGLIHRTFQYNEAPMKRATVHVVSHAFKKLYSSEAIKCVGSALTDPECFCQYPAHTPECLYFEFVSVFSVGVGLPLVGQTQEQVRRCDVSSPH